MSNKLLYKIVTTSTAFLLCSLAQINSLSAAPLKEFNVGNGHEIESLDPIVVDGPDAGIVANALYEGLVTINPKTLAPQPGLAESWTVSSDLLTYTFNLRAAKWSDGSSITNSDFLYSWQRALDPANGAYYAYFFDSIKGAEQFRKEAKADKRNFASVGIKAQGKNKLVLQLSKPSPFLLSLLASPVFAPVKEENVKKFGKKFTNPENLVVSGPFTLESWKLKDRLIVKKNKHYYDANNIDLDAITFYPVEDAKTSYNLYETGKLDWIKRIPLSQLNTIQKRPDFHTSPLLNTVVLRLNTTRGPLQNPDVRRAISMAIDRSVLADKVAREGQIPAYTLIPKGMEQYNSGFKINEEAQKARELLAKAGYPNGKDMPNLVLSFITDDHSKNVSLAVSAMLKRTLNINVSVKNQERGIFYDALDTLNYDIARSSFTAKYTDPMTFLDKFTSANLYNNLTGYKSKEYDALVEKSGSENNQTKRLQLLAEAENMLIEKDAVLVPLYFNASINLWKSKVVGLENNVLDLNLLKNIKIQTTMSQK